MKEEIIEIDEDGKVIAGHESAAALRGTSLEVCINCRRPFGARDVRGSWGRPDKSVGPFCEDCYATIKFHERTYVESSGGASHAEGPCLAQCSLRNCALPVGHTGPHVSDDNSLYWFDDGYAAAYVSPAAAPVLRGASEPQCIGPNERAQDCPKCWPDVLNHVRMPADSPSSPASSDVLAVAEELERLYKLTPLVTIKGEDRVTLRKAAELLRASQGQARAPGSH